MRTDRWTWCQFFTIFRTRLKTYSKCMSSPSRYRIVDLVLRRPASYLYTGRLFSWPLCEVILCAERTWLLRKYEFTRELPYFSTQSPVAYLHSCTSINSVHAASIAILTSVCQNSRYLKNVPRVSTSTLVVLLGKFAMLALKWNTRVDLFEK